MLYSEYQEFVRTLSNCFEPGEIPILRLQLLKDCVGLSNELREFMDADENSELDELGDVLFYWVAVSQQVDCCWQNDEYAPLSGLADRILDAAEKLARASNIRTDKQRESDLESLKRALAGVRWLIHLSGYTLTEIIECNVNKLTARHYS